MGSCRWGSSRSPSSSRRHATRDPLVRPCPYRPHPYPLRNRWATSLLTPPRRSGPLRDHEAHGSGKSVLLESRQSHRARREGVALTKEAGPLGKRQRCWCRVHPRGAGSVPSAAWIMPIRHWLGQPYPMMFFPEGFRGCRTKLEKAHLASPGALPLSPVWARNRHYYLVLLDDPLSS